MLDHKLYDALTARGLDTAQIDSVRALELIESGLTANEAINATMRPVVTYIDGVAYTHANNLTVLTYVALFNEVGYPVAYNWLESHNCELVSYGHDDNAAAHDAVILP